MNKTHKKHLNVRISRETHSALREYAKCHNLTLEELIQGVCSGFLDSNLDVVKEIKMTPKKNK